MEEGDLARNKDALIKVMQKLGFTLVGTLCEDSRSCGVFKFTGNEGTDKEGEMYVAKLEAKNKSLGIFMESLKPTEKELFVDYCWHNGVAISKYYEGEDVKKLNDAGKMTPELRKDLVGFLLRILGLFQKHEFVHLDIKLANILLTEKGFKLLDFGEFRAAGKCKLGSTTHLSVAVDPESSEEKVVTISSDNDVFGVLRALAALTGTVQNENYFNDWSIDQFMLALPFLLQAIVAKLVVCNDEEEKLMELVVGMLYNANYLYEMEGCDMKDWISAKLKENKAKYRSLKIRYFFIILLLTSLGGIVIFLRIFCDACSCSRESSSLVLPVENTTNITSDGAISCEEGSTLILYEEICGNLNVTTTGHTMGVVEAIEVAVEVPFFYSYMVFQVIFILLMCLAGLKIYAFLPTRDSSVPVQQPVPAEAIRFCLKVNYQRSDMYSISNSNDYTYQNWSLLVRNIKNNFHENTGIVRIEPVIEDDNFILHSYEYISNMHQFFVVLSCKNNRIINHDNPVKLELFNLLESLKEEIG